MVNQYATKNHKSFSRSMSDLVELGLKVSKIQDEGGDNDDKKLDELEKKHTEYLLRTMNICSEIFRCCYESSKVSDESTSANETLNNIKGKVNHYIDGFLQKEIN